MVDWIVVLDSPRSLETKLVKAYLENDAGEHRQVAREVGIGMNADQFIENNFAQVWAIANPLADDMWDAELEKAYRGLYRAVVRAGVVAARGQLASLTDVSLAMETEILASDKGGMYTRLKALATSATSVQRDQFFILVSFLVLNDLMSARE